MEVFLEEHGESIIYGLIGLVMVVTITAVISRGIVNIVPDYKKELSRNNSYQIEKNDIGRKLCDESAETGKSDQKVCAL